MAVAVYPGTFDPVHNGHVDVIRRARALFERVVVGVARESQKQPLFTLEERVELLRASVAELDGVEVEGFSGLTVEFARRWGAVAIVKGLRSGDLEYELRMAHVNRRLAPSVETVFLPTSPEYGFVSSTLIKEVARLGGSVEGLVPDPVRRRLAERFGGS
ncbi:Phosphopantetheine adenylyltransferase [bacterium HR32]|nr:Phosphopantetheine adenylyltransferase [bacterium HR32]